MKNRTRPAPHNTKPLDSTKQVKTSKKQAGVRKPAAGKTPATGLPNQPAAPATFPPIPNVPSH